MVRKPERRPRSSSELSNRFDMSSKEPKCIPEGTVVTGTSSRGGGGNRASDEQRRSWWLQLSKLSKILASAKGWMEDKAQKARGRTGSVSRESSGLAKASVCECVSE